MSWNSFGEVQSVKYVDLGDIVPVAWNDDIQKWIKSDLLKARVDYKEEDVLDLLAHAGRALEVVETKSHFA